MYKWGIENYEVFIMYRELVVRAYGEEAIKKIDQLRQSGINITELVLSAVMLADIEKLREEKKKRLACVYKSKQSMEKA